MNVRRGLVKLAVVVCAAALLYGAAGAAELYTYPDDNRFWWFVGTEPAFEILVPSNTGGAYPLYFHRTQFGEEVLEIQMGQDGPVMAVGILKGSSSQISAIRDNLRASRDHLFTNVRVVDDREIETSMGLRAYFYSQLARAADGKSAMFRAVFFSRGDDLVYLTYFLYESDYSGFNRDAWIRAVNTFRWM